MRRRKPSLGFCNVVILCNFWTVTKKQIHATEKNCYKSKQRDSRFDLPSFHSNHFSKWYEGLSKRQLHSKTLCKFLKNSDWDVLTPKKGAQNYFLFLFSRNCMREQTRTKPCIFRQALVLKWLQDNWDEDWPIFLWKDQEHGSHFGIAKDNERQTLKNHTVLANGLKNYAVPNNFHSLVPLIFGKHYDSFWLTLADLRQVHLLKLCK